ncbi:MAG: hypothetical protein EOP51_07270 [Sphingobacteriales bacterium]|nr:MAG: hypothetical protein EOP51_07270 [Sphingobacteriales bacterium]
MNKLIPILAFTIATATACDNSNNSNKQSITDTAESTIVPATQSEGSNCYSYTDNKDTVTMHLSMKGNNAEGTLSYNYFEKDKNTGTISGAISNDTFLGDYTVMSEGTSSVREVVFVKDGETWKEGYGDMEQSGNKVKFKTPRKLDFSNSITLTKVTCK